MIKSKQIFAIAAVSVLVVVLYSLDIKGLVKPKGDRGLASSTEQAPANVNGSTISVSAKQLLNANLANQISTLEDEVKLASSANKLGLLKSLAQKWDDVNQPAPAAFVLEEVALTENNYENWLSAGNHFATAYTNHKDSTVIPTLVAKAINAFSKALESNSNSLDAKSGLGVAYVTDGKNPMQGIQLLLSVVKTDPKNLNANMNLGLFSMKSGQFDKAVNRFKTVIEVKESPEAYFYLGTTYENLGAKQDAIIAYTKSKELAADPGLAKFVDQKIKELNK
ncbi:MAG: hypothetical protein EAZ15_03055 [Sphingobacteriales bacterium]|nr:MAG: hypothetical protein EAZ15_03055 [Sphingobacteriales bacterium]